METNILETNYGKFFLEQFINDITLMFKDKDGYDWFICTVKENKPIKLHAAIPKDIGISVDEDGCIEFRREV